MYVVLCGARAGTFLQHPYDAYHVAVAVAAVDHDHQCATVVSAHIAALMSLVESCVIDHRNAYIATINYNSHLRIKGQK
jgi:hypothetical protein